MPIEIGQPQHLLATGHRFESDDTLLVQAVSDQVNRYGYRIPTSAWDFSSYLKNPVILWAHNLYEDRPPIGRAVQVWGENGLKMRVEFAPTPFAQEIKALYQAGFLHAFSVGFLPLEIDFKADPAEVVRCDLMENSAVPVPADPKALAQALTGLPVERRRHLAGTYWFDGEEFWQTLAGRALAADGGLTAPEPEPEPPAEDGISDELALVIMQHLRDVTTHLARKRT